VLDEDKNECGPAASMVAVRRTPAFRRPASWGGAFGQPPAVCAYSLIAGSPGGIPGYSSLDMKDHKRLLSSASMRMPLPASAFSRRRRVLSGDEATFAAVDPENAKRFAGSET